MFDIDGTLIESHDFDSICFGMAVHDVLGIKVDSNWDRYTHVTDAGILRQLIDESDSVAYSELYVDSVKQRYAYHLTEHSNQNTIREVQGAANFIHALLSREDIIVSFATGGWLESAEIKLAAAGIDVVGIPIATSSDHYKRTEIMKIAEQRTGVSIYESRTYFGDGAWDQHASQSLGYDFILVGDSICWEPSIRDYSDVPNILKYIGL